MKTKSSRYTRSLAGRVIETAERIYVMSMASGHSVSTDYAFKKAREFVEYAENTPEFATVAAED